MKLVESEATLHAMMMTSMPLFYIIETKYIGINAIWEFRNDTKIPVCLHLMQKMCMFCIKTLALCFTICEERISWLLQMGSTL
jgi:hypothetical protein